MFAAPDVLQIAAYGDHVAPKHCALSKERQFTAIAILNFSHVIDVDNVSERLLSCTFLKQRNYT